MDWQQWRQKLADSALLEWEFYGNALPAWLAAAAMFVVALFVMRLAIGVVRRRAGALAERRDLHLAHAVAGFATATKWWFLLIVALYFGRCMSIRRRHNEGKSVTHTIFGLDCAHVNARYQRLPAFLP